MFVYSIYNVGVVFYLNEKMSYLLCNGTTVFCFLSSLPLLAPATTAVFGSYLSALYFNITDTVSCVPACLSI